MHFDTLVLFAYYYNINFKWHFGGLLTIQDMLKTTKKHGFLRADFGMAEE